MKRRSKLFRLGDAWARRLALATIGAHDWPEVIAARGLVSASYRTSLLQWLAPLEAAVRRLLLLEALRAPPPTCAYARKPARKRKAARARATDAPLQFSVFGAARRSRRRLRKYVLTDDLAFRPPAPSRPALYAAAPLARRLEAVLAVLEDRTPHVARLARRIVRAPERAKRCFAPRRRCFLRAFAALLAAVQPQVDAALARLPSPQALANWDSS